MTAHLVIALVLAAPLARAQPAPAAVAAAGLDERIGAQVPLDTPFTAAHLGPTTLRHVIDGKRPVLLVLAYARCTMLCSLVLHGVADVARRLDRTNYQLVLVGLDARETIDEARRKQAALVTQLGRGRSEADWPYLVGDRASIDAVAGAIGFRYAWDPRTEQYAHPAVIFALTPDGRVARYLHGVQFDPAEVSSALRDAAAGRLVSTAAAEVMRCFRLDAALLRAGQRVQTFLQVGAASVFALLIIMIALLVSWERRRGRRS